MFGLIATAIIAGTIIFLWWRAEPLISRALSIAEQQVTKATPLEGEPMPQDFVEWAMNESTEWAREDKLARMRELYGRLHDWEKVRKAMMHEEEAVLKSTF